MTHERLTTFPHDPLLDLDPWVGQRQASFRFERVNGLTGESLGTITPIRNASLTHDTTRTIKRQLTLSLGVVDTAEIDVITDRIDVFMVFPAGAEYPMGRYMFSDASREVSTAGIPGPHTAGGLGDMSLNDEMFMIDQQITQSISSQSNIVLVVEQVLADFSLDLRIESTTFNNSESWTIGTYRGSILESLAINGDYFSPWFGNDKALHFIRSFDPATKIPDFDFDTNEKVLRAGIVETDDLITAPNQFIVISNTPDDPSVGVVGTATIPSSAPHSISNRGFTIPMTQDLQVGTAAQAQAVAEGLANRFTVFERITLSTPLDPRHDSYNVIRWRGENWLELGWSMSLVEGGTMSHVLRKSYL